jgi:hypothetical protein
MLEQRKIFKIRCFYCKKIFVYIADFTCYIKRAYCEKCKKEHLVNKFKRGVKYNQYKEYLAGVRNQLGGGKGDGRIFKGDIDWGEIVYRDKLRVYVQKSPGQTVSPIRKEFIKN